MSTSPLRYLSARLRGCRRALFVLAHLRSGHTHAQLAAGFGVGTTTAYRYVAEAKREALLAGTGIAWSSAAASGAPGGSPIRGAGRICCTYFLSAYTGTIVPTLALGLLDQMINQDVATLLLAVPVVATTLAGALSRPAITAA